VNDMVAAGVPFREAYKIVGMKVQNGEYTKNAVRPIHHTHEGSIGNLCLDKIQAKFNRAKEGIDIEYVHNIEQKLMGLN
ncbi:MAG: argininosuccinate lyase, partial [Odoribacter sp.]|nr:argininosuccinate lyase [Odoribacter sp.]